MIISSKATKKEEKEEKFPILLAHIERDLIVFFTSMHRGVVVYSTDSDRPVGYSNDNEWISCFNKEVWKEFDGVISLANKES